MKRNQYSIKDLENLTNIKAHTIRIWEQRYDLLQPQRTETNIRYYSDADVKKLLNVNLLYTNGFKISKIAKLDSEEIIDQAKNILHQYNSKNSDDVEGIILGIMEMNPVKVESILEDNFEKNSIQSMYKELIIPVLSRVGELWQLNSISIGHEHFFSNILRAFILSKTQQIPAATPPKGKLMLFLHEDEQHELSLLIYYYVFKKEGWECCYLGQNVPADGLKIAYDRYQPTLCITSFIKHLNEEQFSTILNSIVEVVPADQLLISGYIAQNFKKNIPAKSLLIESFEDLEKLFV